jgi:hypothetical protein
MRSAYSCTFDAFAVVILLMICGGDEGRCGVKVNGVGRREAGERQGRGRGEAGERRGWSSVRGRVRGIVFGKGSDRTVYR